MYYLYTIILKQNIMEITIETFLNESINCRSFFNSDSNYGGIDIKRDGVHLGELIGYNIPDENDEDEVKNFTKVVENWLVDNNY